MGIYRADLDSLHESTLPFFDFPAFFYTKVKTYPAPPRKKEKRKKRWGVGGEGIVKTYLEDIYYYYYYYKVEQHMHHSKIYYNTNSSS